MDLDSIIKRQYDRLKARLVDEEREADVSSKIAKADKERVKGTKEELAEIIKAHPKFAKEEVTPA